MNNPKHHFNRSMGLALALLGVMCGLAVLSYSWSRPTQPPIASQGAKCAKISFLPPACLLSLINFGKMPGKAVLIGGVNFNAPTSDPQAIRFALKGNALGFGTLSPLQRLNQQFVAAQLSRELAGGSGSPVAYNALWSPLSCYGFKFTSVTLSNGFTFTPTSMLKDLFQQTELALSERRIVDMPVLTIGLDALIDFGELGLGCGGGGSGGLCSLDSATKTCKSNGCENPPFNTRGCALVGIPPLLGCTCTATGR
jgi:hypothetical protein